MRMAGTRPMWRSAMCSPSSLSHSPGSQPQPDLMGMEWSAKMSDSSQAAFNRGGSQDCGSPRRVGASGEATR